MRKKDDREEGMTELDRLGMRLAAEAHFERQFGFQRERRAKGQITALESLEDLLKRDAEREKDGFPKKIRFRRILVDSGKVIVVPYVEEDQLAHGQFEPKRIVQLGQFLEDDEDDEDEDMGEATGHGKGEVGDVLGEMPLPMGGGDGEGDDGEGEGDGNGPKAGEDSADHAFEEEAYETGKRLMEKLQLPNLREKRKKVPTEEYTYDLTDRHRGSGQLLDKKATLKRIVKTNLVLGRVDKDDLDTTKMVISPQDMIYRVLSRERIWKSRAVVVFMRDFSGSMYGEPTMALVAQHLMIYAWLLVAYERMVTPRFIVHDTRAREVTARQYFGLASGGGTAIVSGYQEINKIVKGEGLDNDYNIYVFQGTDGDDFDDTGRKTIPELEQILEYANRVGVTLFKHPYYLGKGVETSFEKYIKKSGILERRDVFRMHVMSNYDITDEQNVEALRALIAQD